MNKNVIQVWMKEFKNFDLSKYEIQWANIKSCFWGLFFPKTCVICGNINPYGICTKCSEKYRIIGEPRCMCCGKPIQDEESELCYDCVVHEKHFEEGKSLWIHSESIKQSIHSFKYKNKRIFAETYAQLLVQYYETYIIKWEIDGIIPVPIHKKRRKVRGYNQSEVLAEKIVEYLEQKVPIYAHVVSRKEQTRYQKKLDNMERRKNLKGVFKTDTNIELPKHVLLIDDIYTTGSTLNELALELKKNGVQKVFFLTISIGQGF